MGPIFRKLVFERLKALEHGTLEVILPDGRRHTFGGLYRGVDARIEVRRNAFFTRSALFGPIGFGESYVDGDWETPDVTKVIAWFILNGQQAQSFATQRKERASVLNLFNAYNRALHRRRSRRLNTGSGNYFGDHEFSNQFFALWLDATMAYSCAYFDPPELTLEAAQLKKYDILCHKLQLAPGDEALEIGTSWGGFAIHAARKYGCRVTTITLSEDQHREARARVEAAGLSDRISVLLSDYRHVRGRFDKIISIEMLGTVGDRFLDVYFECIHALLKPRGLLALQMITCPDREHAILRDGVDFIQKHIFPGSQLVSHARVTEAINRSSTLNLHDWEDMAPFYAKTMRAWYERFEAVQEKILQLGVDERFLRKWRYYLQYSEAAYSTRNVSVVQAVFSRPNNLRIKSAAYESAMG